MALPLAAEALRDGRGPYALQAAISAEHCKATRSEDTDWRTIVQLYEELESRHPSPIVALNRAVALAMAEGPAVGLAEIEALATSGELDSYHLLYAARADLLRRLGAREDAVRSYLRAIELVTNDSEKRFLERRLREVQASASSIAT
jgi:RNA polymerase sigma-70 factor (ECF subfamily)